MKKKLSMTIGVIAVVTVLGLGMYHSDASQTEPTLTTDEIKSLISDQYPGEITEIELEKDFNKAVYELEIVGKDKKYELKVDGNSGEILKLKEKTVMHATENNEEDTTDNKENKQDEKLILKEKQNEKSKKDQDQDKQTKDKQEKNNNGEAEKSKQKPKDKNAIIDVSEASEIALNEFSGRITEVELDEDDGRLIYEIEIESGELEAEIEIDAHTGEVLVMEIDD
ncbi:PepSY domain-containing protein [Virgibacillus sp. MSJ-26]|uniref:PepSY domain-containing protein n=1 Tax=Virgibacillus sp. MSJ-26 TaxID=2841522 RepID=UPI001C0FE7D2|nr:PepSY domain-containing protein [Virgibacillus sp. MSJ-26]MBU5468567.1 PepSY domain-containing protein [Virgibacillus sp. MSJ-26]